MSTSDVGEKLTVVITTYNRVNELMSTLRSICNYLPGVPVIVLSDGSTDSTEAEVVETYPHIRLVSQKTNEGLIGSRNKLNSLAATDYILSIDDDAALTGNSAIRDAIKILDVHQSVGVVTLPYINVLSGNQVLQLPPSKGAVWDTGTFAGTAHVMRKSAFQVCGGYRQYFIRQGEEIYLSYKLREYGYRVAMANGSPIAHTHSKVRDWRKVSYYYARNDILTILLLWPLHRIPFALLRAVIRVQRRGQLGYAKIPGLRGLVDGVRSFYVHHNDRTPVSARTIRLVSRLYREPLCFSQPDTSGRP